MNIDEVFESAEIKARHLSYALFSIIKQYILVKERLRQFEAKEIKVKEQIDSLNGILTSLEQKVINEIREIKL